MSETIGTYHGDRCADCGALLPADDWSSVRCQACAITAQRWSADNDWALFWREVARLHRTYGVIQSEEPV